MIQEIFEYFHPIKPQIIEGFDDCVIGYDYSGQVRLIYSVSLMIKAIMNEYAIDEIGAIDHLDSILSYLPKDDTPHSPIICQDNFGDII